MFMIVCMRGGLPTSARGPFNAREDCEDWLERRGFARDWDAEGYSCYTYGGSDRLYIVERMLP